MLVLLEIATLEDWPARMYEMVDATDTAHGSVCTRSNSRAPDHSHYTGAGGASQY